MRMFLKICGLTGLLLTAVLAVSGAAASAVGVFSHTGWEFDPVPEGEKVFHEFAVSNNGTAPVEIAAVRTG